MRKDCLDKLVKEGEEIPVNHAVTREFKLSALNSDAFIKMYVSDSPISRLVSDPGVRLLGTFCIRLSRLPNFGVE